MSLFSLQESRGIPSKKPQADYFLWATKISSQKDLSMVRKRQTEWQSEFCRAEFHGKTLKWEKLLRGKERMQNSPVRGIVACMKFLLPHSWHHATRIERRAVRNCLPAENSPLFAAALEKRFCFVIWQHSVLGKFIGYLFQCFIQYCLIKQFSWLSMSFILSQFGKMLSFRHGNVER